MAVAWDQDEGVEREMGTSGIGLPGGARGENEGENKGSVSARLGREWALGRPGCGWCRWAGAENGLGRPSWALCFLSLFPIFSI